MVTSTPSTLSPPGPTSLSPPTPNPQDLAASKYYVFNETGNIMLASTDNNGRVEESVRQVFSEVAVFFAAMTKAITTTINPATPGQSYSLYNYTALGNLIDNSGLFIHVCEEDVTYATSSGGVTLSQELVQVLLGLATGVSDLSFASAMTASMGSEAVRVYNQATHTDTSVANIVFVCEYLLGMPVVGAIVVSMNVADNIEIFQAGPCVKATGTSYTYTMHKDTYLFVTPSAIRAYAGDLESVETDPDYTALVASLTRLILVEPTITGVYQGGSTPATTTLSTSQQYTLLGEFFGSSAGSLQFVGGGTGPTISVASWSTDSIVFTVSGSLTTACPIGVCIGGSSTPAVQTTSSYTIASS
jgi:hypothetical protein